MNCARTARASVVVSPPRVGVHSEYGFCLEDWASDAGPIVPGTRVAGERQPRLDHARDPVGAPSRRCDLIFAR